jgi:hypothetical protein
VPGPPALDLELVHQLDDISNKKVDFEDAAWVLLCVRLLCVIGDRQPAEDPNRPRQTVEDGRGAGLGAVSDVIDVQPPSWPTYTAARQQDRRRGGRLGPALCVASERAENRLSECGLSAESRRGCSGRLLRR